MSELTTYCWRSVLSSRFSGGSPPREMKKWRWNERSTQLKKAMPVPVQDSRRVLWVILSVKSRGSEGKGGGGGVWGFVWCFDGIPLQTLITDHHDRHVTCNSKTVQSQPQLIRDKESVRRILNKSISINAYKMNNEIDACTMGTMDWYWTQPNPISSSEVS